MHIAEPNWNMRVCCDLCDERILPADEFIVWEPVLQHKPWFAFIHKTCQDASNERHKNNKYVVDVSALMDGTLDREIEKSLRRTIT